MTETAGMSPEDAAAARAAEQARIRKERREAKIKAGGSARLNKITGLGGGIQRDPVPTNPPSRGSSPAPSPAADTQSASGQQHADPEEIDISQHYYKPDSTNRIPPASGTPGRTDPANMSDDQLRQMMLGFDRPPSASPNRSGGNSFFDPSMLGAMGGADGEGPDPEDPMMKMLQQMLGGGAGGAGGQNPFAQFAAMNGQQPPQQQQPQQATVESDMYTAVWRALHFVLAIGLGLYVALLAGFEGTKVERERGAFAATTAAEEDEVAVRKQYFFWTFATAETILLTSRFLLDRNRAPSGTLNMIMGFLPDKWWKAYLGTALRYSQIFTTVRSDILVCCFVLGITSWWRS